MEQSSKFSVIVYLFSKVAGPNQHGWSSYKKRLNKPFFHPESPKSVNSLLAAKQIADWVALDEPWDILADHTIVSQVLLQYFLSSITTSGATMSLLPLHKVGSFPRQSPHHDSGACSFCNVW